MNSALSHSPSANAAHRLIAVRNGGYAEPDFWVWCGSPVLGEDGRYHLFASRWPRRYPFHPGWLMHSQIVRAASPTPEGPYRFEEVVLTARDPAYFDGRTAHNPAIRRHGGKFYLFYMGATYPEDHLDANMVEPGGPEYQRIWARKRIGLAVSDSVLGPWRRADRPFLEPRGESFWDAIATTNPAPHIHPDGSLVLMYKSRTRFNGPRLLGMAHFGPDWSAPTYRSPEPLFQGLDLEDPCLWFADGKYYCLIKDMTGTIGGEHGTGILAVSDDAKQWHFAERQPYYSKTLTWDDGSTTHPKNLERPQLLFHDGRPTHLFAATAEGDAFSSRDARTWNTCLRLQTAE